LQQNDGSSFSLLNMVVSSEIFGGKFPEITRSLFQSFRQLPELC